MEWKKVSPDTMPPVGTAVHIAIRNGGKTLTSAFPAVWHNGKFMGVSRESDTAIALYGIDGEVTHWAPWPDPPKDSENGENLKHEIGEILNKYSRIGVSKMEIYQILKEKTDFAKFCAGVE